MQNPILQSANLILVASNFALATAVMVLLKLMKNEPIDAERSGRPAFKWFTKSAGKRKPVVNDDDKMWLEEQRERERGS